MSKASGAQVRAARLLTDLRGDSEVDALPLRLANLPDAQRTEARALLTELWPRILHRGHKPEPVEDLDGEG